MPKISKTQIIIAILALVFGSVFFFVLNSKNDNRVITLTDKGFVPSQLEITIGETIIFKNKTDNLFWPAADIHPYHSDYPRFDPKRALDKDEQWEFTFDRIGKWSFHDHISPSNTGAIVVKSLDGKTGGGCFDSANKDCWTNMITNALEIGGVDAAFDEMKVIHDSNPEFATACHNYGHDIGLKSYILYGTDVELSEKTSYCNAGFFHGYMEGLVDADPDPETINKFCNHVRDTVNNQFGLAEGHCRHGIGHGALEALLYDTLQINESPEVLVAKAMDLCYASTEDEGDLLMRCTSGVYDTFRNWIYDSKGPPSQELVEKIFDYCALPKEDFVKFGCYHEMAKIVTALDNPDYTTKVFDFKKEIAPEDFDEYGHLAMRAFSINFGKKGVKLKPFEELVNFCRTADDEFQIDCVLGIFDGIQLAGTPGEEYVLSSEYCKYNLLTKDETAACWQVFQEEIFYTYPKEKWPEICTYIPVEFKTDRVCVI